MDAVEIGPGMVIPSDELEESVSRSSGPGGQHVNKTSTRVTLRWSIADSKVLTDPTRDKLLERLRARLTSDGTLIVNVDESRSQLMNRETARERLADIVRSALVEPKRRKPSKPSRNAKAKRVDTKKQRGKTKALRGRVDE